MVSVDGMQQALQRYFESPETWTDYASKCAEANRKTNPDHDLLLSAIPPGARVLDVGCGPAIHAMRLVSTSVDYVGLDLSFIALKLARDQRSVRKGIQGSAVSLPFADEAFDVVMSLRMIEYLAFPDRFLEEVVRVLRPGGMFLLNGPAWEMPHLLPPSVGHIGGLRRTAWVARRAGRHLLYQILRNRTYFETVPDVAALKRGNRESDDDALYIVSPYQIERFLRLRGMDVAYRRKDTGRGSGTRSPVRRALRRALLSFPPWQSGFVSTTLIAAKPDRPRPSEKGRCPREG